VEWAKAHSQVQLAEVWAVCPDARALLTLAVPVTSREALLRMACACIRACCANEDTKGFKKALKALEAFAEGKKSWEEVDEAAATMVDDLAGWESDCTNALLGAGSIKDDPKAAIGVIEDLVMALSGDEGALEYNIVLGRLAPSTTRTKAAALKKLADLVRGNLPLPNLEQLRNVGG
jgi:hypothetical protein